MTETTLPRNDPSDEIRRVYGEIAATRVSACCSPHYDPADLAAIPPGAHLGLGTGDPVRAAALREGETLVDLGSGAGVDVFLASRAVGPSGRAYGVDLTPEMIARARAAAEEGGVGNVEFVEAPIEKVPLPGGIADVVVSNCVVNLSRDKRAVLAEALRLLRAGGRLVVSDTLRLPGREPAAPTCDCVAGAMSAGEWRRHLADAGFVDVDVALEGPYAAACCGETGCCSDQGVARALVRARKPRS